MPCLSFCLPDGSYLPSDTDRPLNTYTSHCSYLITGSYVGFATVGIFVQWFLKRGVTWQELTHWGHCVNWKEAFAPDLTGLDGLLGTSITCGGSTYL